MFSLLLIGQRRDRLPPMPVLSLQAPLSMLGGMVVRIIIGVVLFLIGFGSFIASQTSPDGGTVWTGGMLVGAILVFTGVRSVMRQRL